MNLVGSPCYKCERRKAQCHSSCVDYKKWSAERNKRLFDEYMKRESLRKIRYFDKATRKWRRDVPK